MLPGADVTVTQTDTGLKRNAVAEANGTYTIASLPVGPYRLEGVRRASGLLTGAVQLDVSNNGTLVYVPGPVGSPTAGSAVALTDRTGAITRLKLPPKPYGHVRASHDGARIVLDSDDGKEAIIWTYDLAGTSEPTRLTFAGKNHFPILSPDGKRVAFQSGREGDLAIFVQRTDGTGQVARLTKPEKGDAHVPESWSPDGHISFSLIRGSTWSLWTLSLEDKKPAPFHNVQSINPIGSVFSPDGRWIAYFTRQSAGPGTSADGVFVEPFPATGEKYQAPKLNFDFQPLWSTDGKELIYVPSAASGRLAAVSVSMRAGITFENPQTLSEALCSEKASGPESGSLTSPENATSVRIG